MDSQAVTQVAPFDESAGPNDTIVDESLKEGCIVAHDAGAAISDPEKQDGEPVKKAAKLTAEAGSRGEEVEEEKTTDKSKSEKNKKEKKSKSPKEKEAAKKPNTKTTPKKRPAGQALSEPPSTEKEAKKAKTSEIKEENTDQKASEGRDPSKAKKFMELKKQGQLPDEIMQAYEQAELKRGSSMRQELTNIINQTIQRIPGSTDRLNTYVVNKDAAAVLNIKGSHDIKKHKSQWQDGVIFEEAVTRCGTQSALWEAVESGRVASEGGHYDWKQFFYKFPRSSSGTNEVTVRSTAMEIKSIPDDSAAKDLFSLIDEVHKDNSQPALQGQAANAGPQFPSTINFTSRFRSRPPTRSPPKHIEPHLLKTYRKSIRHITSTERFSNIYRTSTELFSNIYRPSTELFSNIYRTSIQHLSNI